MYIAAVLDINPFISKLLYQTAGNVFEYNQGFDTLCQPIDAFSLPFKCVLQLEVCFPHLIKSFNVPDYVLQ